MTSPHTHPAERETPAGEAMREAVAQWLRDRFPLNTWQSTAQAIALLKSGPIASELARLTERAEKAETLVYDLKYAAAGGEDVPLAAHAVTVDDVRRWQEEAAGKDREFTDMMWQRIRADERAEAAEAALTTLRADHAEAVANAREPVGDAWDEVRRLEGECRIFLGERDEWKAVADRERADHAAEVARLLTVLQDCRDTIANPNPGICCTIWFDNLTTLQDHIDSALERHRPASDLPLLAALATTETTDA